MLDEAANEYEARGMAHWALGAAVHAAYWRETLVRGGGASRAAGLVRDIGARGGEGFAYYLPEVASWLGRSAERDPAARELARKIRARAEAVLRRAKTDSAAAVGSSALDEATFYLRTVGLTWRELGILREMELLSREGKRLDRASLAERLGVSPNTLRVHLTRIRAKLDVGDRLEPQFACARSRPSIGVQVESDERLSVLPAEARHDEAARLRRDPVCDPEPGRVLGGDRAAAPVGAEDVRQEAPAEMRRGRCPEREGRKVGRGSEASEKAGAILRRRIACSEGGEVAGTDSRSQHCAHARSSRRPLLSS